MTGINVKDVPVCLLCGCAGSNLHANLKDLSCDNAGPFSFLRCPSCGFIWLSPRPSPEDMPRFYEDYYTHLSGGGAESDHLAKRFLGRFRDRLRDSIVCGYFGYRHIHARHFLCGLGRYLGRIVFLRERASNETQALPFYRPGGRVVDVGCGNGDFLFRLKQLGWEVLGIEPDPIAAETARRRGIRTESKPIEKAGLPDNWADAITMNHVIEHLYEPVSALRECRHILKKGGELILFTPNISSLGHDKFGRSWVALDPPRHLQIFSPSTICLLLSAAGFADVKVRTSARGAAGGYSASTMIVREGHMPRGKVLRQNGACFFDMKEFCLCALGLPKGEDIEVIAKK